MSYTINDKTLIEETTKQLRDYVRKVRKRKEFKNYKFSHPLDDDILGPSGLLIKLKPSGTDVLIDYLNVKALDVLWKSLIRKSIECLRFFDDREPFKESEEKKVIAYGLDNLTCYHDRYTSFESMLYGESSFYRDHVFHSVRTWLLGIFCLTKEMNTSSPILVESIQIDGEKNSVFSGEFNFFEKASMWTIIALCHDLGYPLEKSEKILDKTQEMMKDFIPRPNIWNNFGFSGTQDTINEYILRFISTKMKPYEDVVHDNTKDAKGTKNKGNHAEDKWYLGRVQPKYYLKFAKSLEGFKHGIISAVIIYKMLLYFLESDFNMNDDHHYTAKDARQFYIRREILRSMAAHTCPDVYNINLTTFSSLLFLCDELQEWGRKSWNDMYAGLNNNAIELTINSFTPVELDVSEIINMENLESPVTIAENIERVFEYQYSLYKTTFKDGQYTIDRDLCIKKKMEIKLKMEGVDENKIEIQYMLSKMNSIFSIDFSRTADKDVIREIVKEFDARTAPALYSADVKYVGVSTRK